MPRGIQRLISQMQLQGIDRLKFDGAVNDLIFEVMVQADQALQRSYENDDEGDGMIWPRSWPLKRPGGSDAAGFSLRSATAASRRACAGLWPGGRDRPPCEACWADRVIRGPGARCRSSWYSLHC